MPCHMLKIQDDVVLLRNSITKFNMHWSYNVLPGIRNTVPMASGETYRVQMSKMSRGLDPTQKDVQMLSKDGQ